MGFPAYFGENVGLVYKGTWVYSKKLGCQDIISLKLFSLEICLLPCILIRWSIGW